MCEYIVIPIIVFQKQKEQHSVQSWPHHGGEYLVLNSSLSTKRLFKFYVTSK